MSYWRGDDLGDMLARDLRVVTLEWSAGGNPAQHIVHVDELSVFVEACKKLHHTPGVNPHVEREGRRDPSCSKIWRITAAPLKAFGPYWWAQRDLGDGDQADGARTIHDSETKCIFIDRSLIPGGAHE